MVFFAYAHCVWCDTQVRTDSKICPECGLQSPTLRAEGGEAAAAAPRQRSRSLGFVLAMVGVPLMLSVAYASQLQAINGSGPNTSAPATEASFTAPLAPVAPAYMDSLQRSVWSDGEKSVQVALRDPNFVKFDASFVSVSEGRIVSFCGALPGTAGYGGAMGAQRFISIFGQRYSTVMEDGDTSFDVLWTRVCASPVKAA